MIGRRLSGYAFLTDRESGKVTREFDTVNCGHCNRICHPELKATPGDNYGHCNRCDRDICANCATKMEQGGMCKTWEDNLAKLERQLERDLVMRRDYGL